MPTFEIEQCEIHTQKYRVDADSKAHAIAKLFHGEADPVDNGLEFIEVAEDHGLPAEEHRELASLLQEMGVTVDEAVIPSIRSIVRTDQQG